MPPETNPQLKEKKKNIYSPRKPYIHDKGWARKGKAALGLPRGRVALPEWEKGKAKASPSYLDIVMF